MPGTRTSQEKKRRKKKKFHSKGDSPRFHSIQVDGEVLSEIKALTINPNKKGGGEKCQHERSSTTANVWVTRSNLRHGEEILGTKTNHAGNRVFRVVRHRAGSTVNPHRAPKENPPKFVRVKSFKV